jgi:hypothetical protein
MRSLNGLSEGCSARKKMILGEGRGRRVDGEIGEIRGMIRFGKGMGGFCMRWALLGSSFFWGFGIIYLFIYFIYLIPT